MFCNPPISRLRNCPQRSSRLYLVLLFLRRFFFFDLHHAERKVCAGVFAHQVAFRDALENCEAGSSCLFDAGEDSYAAHRANCRALETSKLAPTLIVSFEVPMAPFRSRSGSLFVF